MKRSPLAYVAMALILGSGVTWTATGNDEAPSGDTETVTREERRQARQAAEAARPRYEGVQFVTATPIATPRTQAAAPPSTTIIEYDNNAAVERSAGLGIVVGNQFDVGGGGNPIAGPWTITGFIAQNAGPAYPVASPAATVVFFGGPGTGTTAPALAILTSVPLTGAIQTFSLATPITGTGSFLGGVVNSTYGACSVTSAPPGTICDGVALDTAQNSTNPLGFQAMQFEAFVIPATGFATIPNRNAIFKVTGSSLPVELMSFSVEDD